MHRILFVCLGNICRSPAAEGIMRTKVETLGLSQRILIDSAATSNYNLGDPPDSRMSQHAASRGYKLEGKARRFYAENDFASFDLILAMDNSNQRNLLALAKTEIERAKIQLMCSYCTNRSEIEVPDPYYGGKEGFELVMDILENACDGLIAQLRRKGL